MKTVVLLCLGLFTTSAGAFENYRNCEECSRQTPRPADAETMTRLADSWASYTNEEAALLGACVQEQEIDQMAALKDIGRWATILYKLRHQLDDTVTKTSCYGEVYKSYTAGRSTGTAADCEELFARRAMGMPRLHQGRQPVDGSDHPNSPVFHWDISPVVR